MVEGKRMTSLACVTVLNMQYYIYIFFLSQAEKHML